MKPCFVKVVISCVIFVVCGVSCFAQTLNQVVIRDFEQGLRNARVYTGTVVNGYDEKIDYKLTVYADPVVIEEVLASMEEADVTTPEGVYLSDLSCTSIEWLEFNRNEELSPGFKEFYITVFAGRSIILSEPIRFYVVARWDLSYNGVDYVIYKDFEQRPGNERIEHYMAAITVIRKDGDRWSVTRLPGSLFPVGSLLTNVRIVVLEDMLTGRFYSPTYELQELYSKSFSDRIFYAEIFDQGWRELYDQKFDLSEIFGTYIYEEYKRYSDLEYYEVREDYYQRGSEENAEIIEKVQESL